MLKKMTITGAIVAVAGLGLGGAALAQSAAAPAPAAASLQTELAASTTAPTTGAKGKAKPGTHKDHSGEAKRGALVKRLGKVSHAQWVSKDKAGTFVTHDAVRGSVSAVSPKSITVRATDGTTETFSVTAETKIHIKGAKGTPGNISAVKPGDEVGVLGTGTAPMVATHILDRGTGHAQQATPTTTAPTTS
jgi:hypothetical protein